MTNAEQTICPTLIAASVFVAIYSLLSCYRLLTEGNSMSNELVQDAIKSEPKPDMPVSVGPHVAATILIAIAAIVALILATEKPTVVTKQPVTKRVTIAERDDGIADEVAMVRSAVVHVYKKGECQGSGCLISSDGIIFTAKHVTDGQYGEYDIKLDDGRIFPVKHAIEDKENDIAFMQLDLEHARRPGPQWAPADGLSQKNYVEYVQRPDLPYAELAEIDRLRMGDKVFIMGSPHGIYNFNSVSLGIVSGINRDLYNRKAGWERYQCYNWHVMLQTTSPAYPGNSGGPVFDLDCNVIGVLVAGEGDTLNFSVPVARFRDTVDDVRTQLALCRFNVVEKEEESEYDMLYHRYRNGLGEFQK